MSDATDRLRAIAQAATDGPWAANNGDGYTDFLVVEPSGAPIAKCSLGPYEGSTDATHIATFDPSLVAAMLDVIEAAEADKFSPTPRSAGEQERRSDAVRSALARFREVANE